MFCKIFFYIFQIQSILLHLGIRISEFLIFRIRLLNQLVYRLSEKIALFSYSQYQNRLLYKQRHKRMIQISVLGHIPPSRLFFSHIHPASVRVGHSNLNRNFYPYLYPNRNQNPRDRKVSGLLTKFS